MPYNLERAVPKISLMVILSTKQSIREEVLVETETIHNPESIH